VAAGQWLTQPTQCGQTVIATGEFPRLAKMADTEWEFLDDERFELGLEWILDGIAARYER
jgi:hypothetical protein